MSTLWRNLFDVWSVHGIFPTVWSASGILLDDRIEYTSSISGLHYFWKGTQNTQKSTKACYVNFAPPQKKYHFHWWWGTDLLPLKASKDSTSLFDMSKPRNLIPICRKPHSGVIDTKPAIVLVVSPAFLEKKHFRFLRIWDYVQKMDSNIPSNFRHKLWSKKNVHKFCKKKTSSCFFQIPTQWDGIHHPNFLPVKW